jgi:hypothetical protein
VTYVNVDRLLCKDSAIQVMARAKLVRQPCHA